MVSELQLGDISVDVVLKDIKNVHLSVPPPDRPRAYCRAERHAYRHNPLVRNLATRLDQAPAAQNGWTGT